jgi:hypothetical protein
MVGRIGATIKDIRWMTLEEMVREGWSRPAVVLELEEGGKIYASCDEEGNGPGVLFGEDADGETVYIFPKEVGDGG